MLYNILVPLSAEISALNVFRYITFRAIWALLTALGITILVGPYFIRKLRSIKFGQYIQEDGVAAHKSKEGTPTMGGLLIIFALVVSSLLWSDLFNPYIWLSLLVVLGFGAVGFVDDYSKISRKQNLGLSSRNKLLGQLIVATIIICLLFLLPAYSAQLAVPFFKNISPDLGVWYLPFAVLVMVGASNAVNLTDGLDGLAIGPMIVAGSCYAIFIYVAGHSAFSAYLQLEHIAGVGEVTVVCGALIGASMGFLWFNAHPAQLFMGDVGSLSLGGLLGFLAVLCKQELLLLLVGGLYVVETLSVVLQVGYFKLSGGKRIFRMAPLHHHFELKGIPESKIIIRFWIVAIVLGLASLSVLKLR